MATTTQWKEIHKFCLCSICLEQLKQPKLLPCLHRCCKECLSSIIQRSYDVIKCPECREEIEIPTDGVDGFKSDFYSKSLVEYVQIQMSLKSVETRECYSCSKHLGVAAYCFKCIDFLCKDCYKVHVTNKTLKDHQKHTLSREDIEAKNISVEKLTSMRDAPRCHIHLDEICKLYCETCNYAPVCIACTYGEHREHNLHESKALAKLKRQELTQKLESLEKVFKEKELQAPKTAKENLVLNVNIEKEKLLKKHDEKDQEIMTKIQGIEGKIREVKQEKQNTEQKIFDSLQNEMEHEIQRVKKKYEDIFKVKKIEINDSFKAWESYLEKELLKLRDKRESVHREKKEILESIEKQLNENEKIIESMSEHLRKIKRMFETLNVLASSILASDNDCSAVQCIPDMCVAGKNLMGYFRKEFPELTTLTNVTINYKHYSFGSPSVTKLSEGVKSKVHINNSYWCVTGVTSSGDGNIVISGYMKDYLTSFIIVIDVNGRILQDMKIKSQNRYPYRYCEYLTQHKVASVCAPNEIGLFDVRDCSYMKKTISDVTNSWPKDCRVTCVATDPVNNHILVGGLCSRDVYILDDQLSYLHILTLPEMIKWPRDMAVSDDHLLVCDYKGKKCYVTSMGGSESNLVGEFMEPNVEESDVGPVSVCIDKNHFVYVLWRDSCFCEQRYLVQYNNEGSQVKRKVDENASVITVVETSQGEKLLVATAYMNIAYLYDLITDE